MYRFSESRIKALFRKVLYSIVVIFFGLSNAISQQTLSPSVLLTTDIKQSQPADDIIQLLAGTEEISIKTQQASVPLTRGVAIIVSESTYGLFGDSGVSSIANSLNQWGWLTLILPAPMLSFSNDNNLLPEQVLNARSSLAAFNQEGLTRYSLALSQRIEAALNVVQSTPGYRLVISHGISSAGIIRLYSQGSLVEPDGLVVAGPFWPESNLNRQLPLQLAETAFPVLDITNEWDNRWSQKTQTLRLTEAITELKMHYRQREIVGTEYNQVQYDYLAKEIYGWLSYLGW
jgi:hypothetical protein